MEIAIQEIVDYATCPIRWHSKPSSKLIGLKSSALEPLKKWAANDLRPTQNDFLSLWEQYCSVNKITDSTIVSDGAITLNAFYDWAIAQGKPRAVNYPYSIDVTRSTYGIKYNIVGTIDLLYGRGDRIIVPWGIKFTSHARATRMAGLQSYEMTAWAITLAEQFAISPKLTYYVLNHQRFSTIDTRRSAIQIEQFYRETWNICNQIQKQNLYHNYGFHCDSCSNKESCLRDTVKPKGDHNA
jgi:hypothetical protein